MAGITPFQKPVRIKARISVTGAPILFNSGFINNDPYKTRLTNICNGTQDIYLYTEISEDHYNSSDPPKRPQEFDTIIQLQIMTWLKTWSDRQFYNSPNLVITVIEVKAIEHVDDIVI